MLRDRGFLAQQGINQYVPKMQMAYELTAGVPAPFSLGKPAVVSANNIITADNAQAVAATIVTKTTPFTMDSTYGRTIRLTPSGDPGNAASVDIFGDDYLGQPMVERFTGASGSTAILYGKKAFYRVRGSKIVTASTNAVNWAAGTGFRLGLPYKSDIAWAKEGGLFVPVQTRLYTIWEDWDAAETIAGGSRFVRIPFPGFVKTLMGLTSGGGGATDPVITAKLGGTAITGLTVTNDANGASGAFVSGTPTTAGYNANNRLIANGLVEIVGAAAAGAGATKTGLEITPTQFTAGDTTDPATALTADPRGTYESLAVFDGATEFVVALVGDKSYNTSNNGGLHGIKHVAVA